MHAINYMLLLYLCSAYVRKKKIIKIKNLMKISERKCFLLVHMSEPVIPIFTLTVI